MSKTAQTDLVIDDGDLRRYRTEIPNILDDSDLSVYAFRLYVHLKRVAGDSGKCFQGSRRLAKQCKMSSTSVVNAKHELEAKGLIRITAGDAATNTADTIRIVNIWRKNFETFLPCSPIEQGAPLASSPAPVVERPCSPIEHPARVVEHKNKPDKKEPIKKELIYKADATAPPEKIKKKRESKADPRTETEPIRSVYVLTGFRPPLELYDEVIRILGVGLRMAHLSACRREWLKRGYNPKNWDWLFSWYVDGIPESTNGRNGHNGFHPKAVGQDKGTHSEWTVKNRV